MIPDANPPAASGPDLSPLRRDAAGKLGLRARMLAAAIPSGLVGGAIAIGLDLLLGPDGRGAGVAGLIAAFFVALCLAALIAHLLSGGADRARRRRLSAFAAANGLPAPTPAQASPPTRLDVAAFAARAAWGRASARPALVDAVPAPWLRPGAVLGALRAPSSPLLLDRAPALGTAVLPLAASAPALLCCPPAQRLLMPGDLVETVPLGPALDGRLLVRCRAREEGLVRAFLPRELVARAAELADAGLAVELRDRALVIFAPVPIDVDEAPVVAAILEHGPAIAAAVEQRALQAGRPA